MNSPALLCSLLLTSAAVLAQDPMRIAGFDSAPIAWVQNIEDADAVIRYDELAGEYTLLFVHTTVDETEAGPTVAAGIYAALPFMESPLRNNWQLTSPELAAMSGYSFSGQAPMIPPRRLANHIATFVGTGYAAGYGTSNLTSTTYETKTTTNGMVGVPTLNSDERQAWANSVWTWQESINEYSFSTAKLGRESIIQAAYEYAPLVPWLPPLNDDSLAALGDMMDQKIGFEMYVQAAHIKPPSSTGPIQVRLSRHVRIRRLSLQQTTFGWASADRYVPNPTDNEVNTWFAPLGGEMHIIFPSEVSSLGQPTQIRAYVPTTNGLVTVEQTPNPLWMGEVVRPNTGIFLTPTNTTSGIVFFERLDAPGVPFAPLGFLNRGAQIVTYTVPAPLPNNGGGTQPVQ